MLPLPFRQEQWTLQSASADQPHPPLKIPVQDESIKAHTLLNSGLSQSKAMQQAPNNLVLARAIHQLNPSGLVQKVPRWWYKPRRMRIAFLLPGELRCIERSKPLLQAFKKQGDLFICTTSTYETSATNLKPTALAVIEQSSILCSAEKDLPVASMRQWHKLAACMNLMLQKESERGLLYTHLVKLRSDYYYLQPQSLIKELSALGKEPLSGLIGSSDKVFAGPRNLMLLMQGFWHALSGHYLDRSLNNCPINLEPILKGDESAKWYGLGFPERLVGCPETVDELKATLIQGGPRLSQALAQPWLPDEPLIKFFSGHPRFPSEVAFARFLNFNGIPMRNTPGLRGFLYSDRSR